MVVSNCCEQIPNAHGHCRMLFVAAPTVTECILVVPDAAIASFTGSVLAKHFLPLTKAEGEASPVSTTSLYRCQQSSLSPSLYVRDAEPEDFDDLRPVFNAQSDVLESRYGGDYFYLAEVIKAASAGGGDGGGSGGGSAVESTTTSTVRCLVAEVDGKAVGMMALSSDVDVDVLRSGFDVAFITQHTARDKTGSGEEWKTSRERKGGMPPSCVAITLFCIDPQVRCNL